MTIITVQEKKQDLTCSNIGCKTELGYYDVKKGRRFCYNCKVSGVLLWRCANFPICTNIISGCTCRETRKFCDGCKGMTKP